MSKCIRHSIIFVFLAVVALTVRAQDSTQIFPPALEQAPDTDPDEGNVSFDFNEKPEEVQVATRTVPATEVRAKKLQDDYWYADQAPANKKAKEPGANGEKGKRQPHDPVLFHAPWWRVLFWVLLAGFLALLIWYLVTNNVNIFRRSDVVKQEGSGEEPVENIFEMDFEQAIAAAVGQKNYRLAVRLLYLRTLRDLSNRNLIHYTHEKTNSDYLMQLEGTSYYRNFFGLTRNFDYTWYGQFELSRENYEAVQRDFSSFKQQLH